MRISVDIKTTVASWEKLARFVRHEKLLFYFKTTSFWGYFGAKPWGRERSAAENSQLIPIFSLENQEIDFFEKILEKMNIFVKLKWKKSVSEKSSAMFKYRFPGKPVNRSRRRVSTGMVIRKGQNEAGTSGQYEAENIHQGYLTFVQFCGDSDEVFHQINWSFKKFLTSAI